MTAETDRKALIDETPERHERHARRWSARASYREVLKRLSDGADDHHSDHHDGGKRRASG